MADKDQRVKLKHLGSIENLQRDQVLAVLEQSADWIKNFYNESAGHKKVAAKFPVKGFSGNYFDLSTAREIESGNIDYGIKEPYIFLSDLLNFVKQIRENYENIRAIGELNDDQKVLLNKLSSDIFNLVGIVPQDDHITVQELWLIEDPHQSNLFIRYINELKSILGINIGYSVASEQKVSSGEEPDESGKQLASSTNSSGGTVFPVGSGGSDAAADQGGGPEPDSNTPDDRADRADRRDQRPDQPTDQPPSPFKLAELDPQSKLYLQSLSIITINQALNRYFNDAALQKMGLPPGTRVTFDQLPLGIRQQLMDRAFLQVETLLLSGSSGDLQDLIKDASKRINFANQSALNLLIDVHGMKLLNQAVKKLVVQKENSPFATNLAKNQQQELQAEQLSQRVKAVGQIAATSTTAAEAVIAQFAGNSQLAKNLEQELYLISSEAELDDFLQQNLEPFLDRPRGQTLDLETQKRIVANVRSLVETFIQQGLPPEYFISHPESFSYTNFRRLFGNDLSGKQYEQHKAAIAELIVFYWKRKRAIWAREIRAEFGQEKYTPEEAAELAKKNPHGLAAQQGALRTLNYSQSGRAVAETLADPNSHQDNPELSDFIKQQQDLIVKQLEAELAKQNNDQQQQTLQAFFEFYLPGAATVYTVEVFQQQIAPQINPMDYYMLMANAVSGERLFTSNDRFTLGTPPWENPDYSGSEHGLLPQAFTPGTERGGDDLLNNAATRKALEWGLRATAGAASGGASEAVFKTLDTIPGGQMIKDKLASEALEWLRKYWPVLLIGGLGTALMLVAPILAILLPVMYLAFKYLPGLISGGGLGAVKTIGQEVGSIIGERELIPAQQLEAGGTLATEAGSELKLTADSIYSTAINTAGKAVLITVAGAASLVVLHEINLNSAFLTHFPTSEDQLVNSVEKTSKYAEMSKTAKILSGCRQLENNGAKCKEAVFPVTIEYTVTITPKEDFTIQINNIKDKVVFRQSQSGWEEEGRTPPIIDQEVNYDFNYFHEIIRQQREANDIPINISPTPFPGEESFGPTPGTSGGAIVLEPGTSLTFTYILEGLDENYNHTAITNFIEVDFYYQNNFMSGSDSLKTGANVCLGECSGDAGCWPMTGALSQMPYDNSYSHAPVGDNDLWHDAYDIGTGLGPVLYGRNVYAPYDGRLCFVGCSNTGFGCHFNLIFTHQGESHGLKFAHFQDPHPSISTPNSCIQVNAGFLIGRSGNRGFSSGNHLHYAAAHGGSYYFTTSPGRSIIENLVPEDNAGNWPPVKGGGVTTCYE